jgi:uncharacterized protein (TIGR00251 family)
MPLLIEIKAAPQSGRHEWSLDSAGRLKVHLKNPAEDHKANHEIIKSLAEAVGIPQSKVEIVSGIESRNKKVKIGADITFEQLLEKLGLEQQQDIFKKV